MSKCAEGTPTAFFGTTDSRNTEKRLLVLLAEFVRPRGVRDVPEVQDNAASASEGSHGHVRASQEQMKSVGVGEIHGVGAAN